MKWERFEDNVREWINIAWVAVIAGIAYSLGKNLCDHIFK